jgi:hypothetical protein
MTAMAKIVAVTEQMEEAGAIVLWHLRGDINLTDLSIAWSTQNLDEKLLPNPTSNRVALNRTAMSYKDIRRLVRQLPNRGGWAIVDEIGTAGKLNYAQVCNLKLDAADELVVEAPGDDLLSDAGTFIQINAQVRFEREKASLNHNDVSYWLTKLIQRLDSLSLREGGGVYFIPRHRLNEWRTYVAAIRTASEHVMYEVPAMHSEETVAAIVNAITREAEEEAKGIEAELDKLSGRAIKTRAERCSKMSKKVASYEALLGQGLDALQERLQRLQADIAAAALITTGNEEAVV